MRVIEDLRSGGPWSRDAALLGGPSQISGPVWSRLRDCSWARLGPPVRQRALNSCDGRTEATPSIFSSPSCLAASTSPWMSPNRFEQETFDNPARSSREMTSASLAFPRSFTRTVTCSLLTPNFLPVRQMSTTKGLLASFRRLTPGQNPHGSKAWMERTRNCRACQICNGTRASARSAGQGSFEGRPDDFEVSDTPGPAPWPESAFTPSPSRSEKTHPDFSVGLVPNPPFVATNC